MSGQLEKLKIQAFDKEARTGDPARTFEVMFNPTNFTKKYTVEFKEKKGKGTSPGPKQFDRIKPGDLTLDFLIDGTGTVGTVQVSKEKAEATVSPQVDVMTKVDEFRETCLGFIGKIHRPHYLRVSWGKLVFDGSLISMDVKYTLFDRAGKPLRATITATFSESIEEEERVRKEGTSSPDLTHVRTVQEGDTLPLMTFKIYGDSKYYLQVAKANKLKDFRKLQPGQQIYFPPIDKSSN